MTRDQSLLAGNTTLAFSTPVTSYVWPDMDDINAQLVTEIKSRARAGPGIVKANAGSWHSELDLLSWDAPCINAFRERLTTMAQELGNLSITPGARRKDQPLRMVAWANLAYQGDYHELHDHPGSHWSGVYYATGIPEDNEHPSAGRMELLDPRTGINMMPLEGSTLSNRVLVDPEPGLMVCFPSWLKHLVHPMRRPGERVSLSFNLRFEAD